MGENEIRRRLDEELIRALGIWSKSMNSGFPGRISKLEGKIEEFTKRMDGKFNDLMTNHILALTAKLDLLDRRMSGRPSWGVTFALMGLGSLCTGLIVSIVGLLRFLRGG